MPDTQVIPGETSWIRRNPVPIAMVTVFLLMMGSSIALGQVMSRSEDAPPPKAPEPTIPPPVFVTGIVDGDTIDTTEGRVRVIGIGAPDVGECGYEESIVHAAEIAPVDSEVVLTGDGTDRNGLLWRHVATWIGDDFGLEQITGGFAVARYDSRDGYKQHLFQDAYITADAGTEDFSCAAPVGPRTQERAPIAPEMPPLPPAVDPADQAAAPAPVEPAPTKTKPVAPAQETPPPEPRQKEKDKKGPSQDDKGHGDEDERGEKRGHD